MAVAAPAVQQLVGTGDGGFAEALATSEEQSEIVVTNNPNMPIPNWNFKGVPVGIDIRKVVSNGHSPSDHHRRDAQEGGHRAGRGREGPSLDAMLQLGPRGAG